MKAFGRFVFVLVLIAPFAAVSLVLTSRGTYCRAVASFCAAEPNSVDVLVVGSSHAYCTFNPIVLFRDFKITSHVLATQSQPLAATYHYVKLALKTQRPKVVVVESFMLTSDGVENVAATHDAVQSYPWTGDKLALIRDLKTHDSKLYYYCTLPKFHSRWKELLKWDFCTKFSRERDPYRGYKFYAKKAKVGPIDSNFGGTAVTPLNGESLEWLRRIVELVTNSGAKVLLVTAPYVVNRPGRYLALRDVSRVLNLEYLDLVANAEQIGLSATEDFCDWDI